MKTFLDWSKYEDAGMGDAYADIPKSGGDYAKAIAVCINSGICEQERKGVMCPSFRISENPYLSTGGRVKLLKAALNSDDPLQAFDDEKLIEAMDLCVSCKGCKRECENEVDMAMIKAEFLAQRQARHGISWRNKLFASLPTWLEKSVLPAKLIALRNRSKLVAKLGEVFLKIRSDVSLPEPAIDAFSSKAVTSSYQPPVDTDSEKPEVVLFVDTFNRYFNPQVADAAFQVLAKAGYSIELAEDLSQDQRPLCCGRTYLANGMIEQARENAKRMVDTLAPHVAAGKVIVGLEPSCILSLRDEHLSLGLGDDAKELAAKVVLFEEFIAKELMAKRWDLKFKAIEGERFLIHGHCHQKAVGAMKSMRRVLKLIPDFDSDQIESSCCGMAGHFGLEAEHRSHSKQMAEQGLYPALRAEPNATPIANGFSCQQQIKQGQFNSAKHVAEVLFSALEH